jgi:hypothetical protein
MLFSACSLANLTAPMMAFKNKLVNQQ